MKYFNKICIITLISNNIVAEESNFNYISEFLDKVSGVRLISGKREIDVNSIMSIMNDIILKYQKINKVLRKH